jgi:hypothetical protein
MKEIKIIIERSKDAYWAYSENVDGVNGVGDTVQEVKQSALEGIEIQKKLGNLKPGYYKVSFRFDAESLLTYYKKIFSAPAWHQLTGINEKQIHHYATGLKKPRPAQKEKIEKALHQLGEELMAVEL